jgi:hypothetical protein
MNAFAAPDPKARYTVRLMEITADELDQVLTLDTAEEVSDWFDAYIPAGDRCKACQGCGCADCGNSGLEARRLSCRRSKD